MSSNTGERWVKTLILMRHAKSDYPPGVADIDRPLNGRGRIDAPAAGRWIETHVGIPDVVVRSPAVRVQQTWELATEEWATQPAEISIDERIYEASVGDLLRVISELPPAAGSALIIGHNPGLEDTVHVLAQAADAQAAGVLSSKFPTSAIAVLRFPGEWGADPAGYLEACVIPRG